MKKLLFVLFSIALCCRVYGQQFTVTVNATGAPGSNQTGTVDGLGNTTEGDLMVSNTNDTRGWAVFNLASAGIPAGSIVTSVVLTFTKTSAGGSPGFNPCLIMGSSSDFSTETGTPLYFDCTNGTQLSTLDWVTAAGVTTIPLDVPFATLLVQNNYNSVISLGFSLGASDYDFTITGEGGATADQPQLQITYLHYCVPGTGAGGCTAGDDINSFLLTGEFGSNINDVATGCSANAYDDRTSEFLNLAQGISYIANISTENSTDQNNVVVWIDMNDDGVFEDTEFVGSQDNISTSGTPVTIAIPATAMLGNHRMRVMDGVGVPPAFMDPCNPGVWANGETHDYMVGIVALPVCTGQPTIGTASASMTSVCASDIFFLSLAGGNTSVSGLSYQWQSSPAAANTWTNLGAAGITGNLTTTGQLAATDYRCILTCINSGLIDTSNIITVNENLPTACYCIPYAGTAGCSQGDDINTFILAGSNATNINDVNTGCVGASAYDDRTAESVDLQQNAFYVAQVSTEYPSGGSGDEDDVNIWIDFNDDGVLTTSERVAQHNGITTTNTGVTITIPAGVALGTHRMRVMVGYNQDGGMDACNNSISSWDEGETHDYTVNIIPAVVCDTVTNLAATSISASGATISWTTVAGAAGYEYAIDQQAIPPATGTSITAVTTPSGTLLSNTVYYAHIRTNCGNSYSEWVTIMFTTLPDGINGPVTSGFAISAFPNPAKSTVTIQVAGTIGKDAKAILSDLEGRVIKVIPIDAAHTEINLGDIAAGTYFIKYTDELNNTVIKINKG